MQGYRPENIDCFYFQYTHCAKVQCNFQHRQSCKDSSEICLNWFRHRKCRNRVCPRKHLNHEVMVAYFLCPAEKNTNHCLQLTCPMYHEKARQFIEHGIIPPNPVPTLSQVRRKKMVHFVYLENPQVQNMVKSGNQLLNKVRSFIANSVREGKLTQDRGRSYYKEILHTILFYGNISDPVIEPNSFFEKEEFDLLSNKYPDVFRNYNTHLPRRPPFTVLLDAVIEILGTRNHNEVFKCLLHLTEEMVLELSDARSNKCGNIFVSTVISCCYFVNHHITNEKTDNYFGASVSCRGRQQKEIMIDILCCETWHQVVSLAVCIGNWYKNQCLLFPETMYSIAYNVTFSEESLPETGTTSNNQHGHTGVGSEDVQNTDALENNSILKRHAHLKLRAPCERCLKMFPNIVYHPRPEYHNHPYWEYGNCAECESLSQLLYANPQIVMRLGYFVQRTILYSPVEQVHLPNDLIFRKHRRLVENLRSLGFDVGEHLSFYDPSGTDSTALEVFQP
ncbi:uncharacterized protein [Chiloscyllium punctatum]|uniref:uncharacterized protein isoform X1 n=1 Tax=Chiloscyllium punctatum TaxID=137246 RepID=UPI003B63F67F